MSIEQIIAETIRENLEEIVKNAVHEAMTDVRAQLDSIEEKVRGISRTVTEMSEDTGVARAADIANLQDGVYATLEEITDEIKRAELNTGRAELRLARAAGKVA